MIFDATQPLLRRHTHLFYRSAEGLWEQHGEAWGRAGEAVRKHSISHIAINSSPKVFDGGVHTVKLFNQSKRMENLTSLGAKNDQNRDQIGDWRQGNLPRP